jgi:Spy/CpxP family protein refolding chaperone
MSRVRCLLVLAVALVWGATLLAAAHAQAPAAESPPPGFWFMAGPGNVLGLLNLEQVQKELKLNEEQIGKVREVGQKLWEEMREQFSGVWQITDWEKRRARMAELGEQIDQKARGQLRDVLSAEQIRRLFQIRIQVRGAVYALNTKWIASRLKLTEEQRKKVAEIDKTTQKKTADLFGGLQNLSDQERREKWGELFQKLRELQDKANEQAVKLLTAEQKEGFEKIRGEKFELQMRRGGS